MSCQPIAGYEREMFWAGCPMNIGSKKLLREVASTFCGAQALIIGAAAIVLCAMKVKEPTAKHQIWTGVLALMLLLPIWTLWGPKASLRLLPPLTHDEKDEKSPEAEAIRMYSVGQLGCQNGNPGLGT
jgi:hypothetical protein